MGGLQIGRHRLEFIYQNPKGFQAVVGPHLFDKIKSENGFAQLAGIELMLLDCAWPIQEGA